MLGGEAAPDAELMALSTVPAGVAAEALGYLREGGPGNLRELAAFLSDTVLLTGEGFAPPQPMPQYGVHHPASAERRPFMITEDRGRQPQPSSAAADHWPPTPTRTRPGIAHGRGHLLPGARIVG